MPFHLARDRAKRSRTLLCLGACALALTLGASPRSLAIAQDAKSKGIKREDSTVKGFWDAPQSMPVVAVHAALLPTWEVLVYSSGSAMRLLNWWDWSYRPTSVGRNLFCTGHAFLSDGSLLVTGGHLPGNRGTPDAHLFDPSSATWTRLQDMVAGRWYPTDTALPDGRVLVMSGLDEDGIVNRILEIFTPGAGWEQLDTLPFAPPLYPFMFVLPDGELFYAGPSNPTRRFDLPSVEWTTVGNSPIGGGSAVMYAPGQVLKSGGGDPATARTVVIDMNADTPVWREVAPMGFARRRHNLTLLPDGRVLATGGTRVGNELIEAVYAAELWDPTTEQWTTLSNMTVPRMYHSTALLLPDGRVMSAGGDGMLSAELFSPPYLFAEPRPEIVDAPAAIGYESTFDVLTPDAFDVASVALIRPSAVTHAFNQEQRYVPLDFVVWKGGLTIHAPINPNWAPPGYYMLFLVNTSGTPSFAWFLHLDRH